MEIKKSPNVGWGILNPDPVIAPETLKVIESLGALPIEQRDALLTRAVGRYLSVELGTPQGQEPTEEQMVRCSSALSNFMFDIMGRP